MAGVTDSGGSAGNAGVSIAGSVANAGANIIDTAMTNAANAKQNDETRAYNLDLWNKQNAYNTPSAQMARYAAAGLNSNLIYGSGSASSGNASPPSPASSVNFRQPDLQLPQLTAILQQLAQTALTTQQNKTEVYKTAGAKEDADMKSNLNTFYFAPYTSDDVNPANNLWATRMADLQQKMANVGLTTANASSASSLADLNSRLRKYNMTANDSIYARMLTQGSNGALGGTSVITDMLKSFWNSIANSNK